MKRFLLITIDYPPNKGGVARYLFEMASYFGERMIVVKDGLLFDQLWPKWIKAFWPLWKNRKRFDVLVVSHVLPLGIVAMIHRRLFGKPYVVIMHGMDFALARRNSWKKNLTKRIVRHAELVLVNSESLAREVLGFVKPKAVEVIYPCLSHALRMSAESFARDQTIGAQDIEKPVNLLTVSRLVPRKGHFAVLDALALLKSDHRIKAFQYRIIGSGPMFSELEKHVKELGLVDEITFLQNATDQDLVRYYKESDVFIMPTEHIGKDIEGFGTVYIEAAAFGLPTIASDLPGVTEAVLDRQTGLLVPSGSVIDIAEAIERLAADPSLRMKLGGTGRARALSEFVALRQFAKLDELL